MTTASFAPPITIPRRPVGAPRLPVKDVRPARPVVRQPASQPVPPALARPVQRPAPQPVRQSAPQPVRLTRRGRLVLFVLCLSLALVALVLVAGSATGTAETGAPVPVETVTVQPGDTLWGIAAEVRPGEDPRQVVHEIAELNGLSGSLQIGDEIAVPLPARP